MARALILSLTAALALAACAHQPAPAAATPPSGMAWNLLHAEGEGAKLVFGRAESDDVLLMLTCEPGSGAVRLAAAAPTTPAHPALALSSDGAARRYPAQAGPAGFSDGVVLEAATRADDPVLARFAASGRISLEVDGRKSALPPDPSQARSFLAACRG